MRETEEIIELVLEVALIVRTSLAPDSMKQSFDNHDNTFLLSLFQLCVIVSLY